MEQWLNKFIILVYITSITPFLWAQNNSNHKAGQNGSLPVIDYNFGETGRFKLKVDAVIDQNKGKKNHLGGFIIKMWAQYYGLTKPNDTAVNGFDQITGMKDKIWFSLDADSVDGRIKTEENKKKVQLNKHYLVDFAPNEGVTDIDITSKFEMEVTDSSLELGYFPFIPELPGYYKMTLTVHEKNNPGIRVGSLSYYVYFACADIHPDLKIEPEKISLPAEINLPILDLIFLDRKNPPAFSNSLTDRLFRTLLFSRIITGLAYSGTRDTLSIVHFGDHPGLSVETRLKNLIAEYGMQFHPDSESDLTIKTRKATPVESDAVIFQSKNLHLLNDEEQLAIKEENRVFWLKVNAEAERRLYEPISIQRSESQDSFFVTLEVNLGINNGKDTDRRNYLNNGRIVITPYGKSEMAIIDDTLSTEQLRKLEQDKLTIPFPTAEVLKKTGAFRTFEVRATLFGQCCGTVKLYRNFSIVEPKARKIDEVFAVFPFDKTDSRTEKRTRDRIKDIVTNFFTKLRHHDVDMDQGLQAQLFFTGHTDRIQLIEGKNDSLSFKRAETIKSRFIEAIKEQAKENDFQVVAIYRGDANRHYSEIVAEKLRLLVGDNEVAVKLRRTIPQKLQSSYQNIKRKLTTLELQKNGNDQTTVFVDLVSVGFAEIVPFYRLIQLSEKLKFIFEKDNHEIPTYIYADEKDPAGRVMNRRVEVSLKWEQTLWPRNIGKDITRKND